MKKFFLTISFLFTLTTLGHIFVESASALSEDQEIASSGERLISLWQNMLSGEYQFVVKYQPGYYGVQKYRFVTNSFQYDIHRTSSIVSPYILKISFNTVFSDNLLSFSANGVFDNKLGRRYGFRTSEDAEANVAELDFGQDYKPYPINWTIAYVYQSGFWIYKGPTDNNHWYFDEKIGPFLKKEEINQKFQKLLKVPVREELKEH